MAANRGVPTTGPRSGTQFAQDINNEVRPIWTNVALELGNLVGTGNAIQGAFDPAISSYADQTVFRLKPIHANTGPVVLSANGHMAWPLVDELLEPLQPNALTPGRVYLVSVDLANQRFIIVSGGGAGTAASVAVIKSAEQAAIQAVEGQETTSLTAIANAETNAINDLNTVGAVIVDEAEGARDDAQNFAVSANTSRQLAQAALDALGSAQPFESPMYASTFAAQQATIDTLVSYVRTNGFAQPTDGGAALYKKVGSEPSHAGKFQSSDGAWWELSADQDVSCEMFGAIGDGNTTAGTGTDNTIAIQNAIDFMDLKGGGTVRLGKGIFGINSFVRMKNKVNLAGAGMGATVLYALVDGISIIRLDDTDGSEDIEIKDLTAWGYGDRNPALGEDTSRAIFIGRCQHARIQNVRTIYSRHMGICVRAERAEVLNCEILKTCRDGINVSDVTYALVSGNTVIEAGDDAIALNVFADTTRLIKSHIAILGNRFEKCLGLKVLGARHVIIANNRGRFYYGYGINVSLTNIYTEGRMPKFSVVITNNSLVDGMDSAVIGYGAQGSAIFLSGTRNLGSGGEAITTLIGDYNSATGAFQVPDPFINKGGIDNPRAPNSAILISGNTIKQTLAGMTTFSSSGFGQLWENDGPIDPAVTTLIRTIEGIDLSGLDLDSVTILGNIMNGVRNAVRIQNFTYIKGLLISSNNIFRCTQGISIAAAAALHIEATVTGCLFDIDPYHESSLRTQPLDGTWTSTTNTSWNGIYAQFIRGLVVTNCAFKNCQRNIYAQTALIHASGNRYIWDWSGATPRGIAQVANEFENFSLFQDCNPTSPTFGQFSSVTDSGFMLSNGSMPSAGYFRRGQLVRNNSPALASGKVLLGWMRLTNGNGHVLNTDWSPVYMTST
ncbi:right-handed parallel beta-helix repeat-containing protein [Rhodoligotrophos ferricapiens]|uniref:right-handed parallel beta-helix repeat-containing protein n=1 Tax=Rhodoligotrophos ferricapiens TaxID=3069264 RepID=UPI00315E01DF